jgi:RNA recognition motif-containing protein
MTIEAGADDVMDFLANPQNLPRWNRAFCRSVRRQGDKWIMESAEGSVAVKFLRDDRAGVLDQVMGKAGREWMLPLRVLPNGQGTEVVLTLIQGTEDSENEFHRQLNRAQQGLRDLKDALEKPGSRRPAAERIEDADTWSPVEASVPETAESTSEAPAESPSEDTPTDSTPEPAAEPVPSVPGCGVKLFVGNLPFQWSERQLHDHFAAVGAVASVEVAKFGRRGRSRGFGFVEMVNEADTQNAIDKLHGSSAGSRSITVRLSRPKEARQPEPQPEGAIAPESAPEIVTTNPLGIEEPEDGQLQQPALNPSAHPRRQAHRGGPAGRGGSGGRPGRGPSGPRSGGGKGPREVRGRFQDRQPRRTPEAKPITTGEYEFFPRGQAVDRPAEDREDQPRLTRHGHSVEASPYFEDTGDVENRGSRPRTPPKRRPARRR